MPSVLLFRPIYDPRSRSTPVFPWALVYLAGELVKRGVDVDLLDGPCTPDCEARAVKLLERKRPVAVGITSMTGDQIRFGLRFARLVRAHSDAAIVWGGVHASLLPEQTARHPLVDYVVAGEGEYAFADLVECLATGQGGDGIPGVFFERNGEVVGARQEGFIDLSALPDLPFDLIDVERYITKRPGLGVERYFEICTSRGCPHRCGFCYIESVHDRRWRYIDADVAVDNIKTLVRRFDLDCVSFREDNFFVSRTRVERIARRLIEERVGVKWAASSRIDYFAEYTPEFVDLLRQSGCVLLTFGVESGADRVLEFIRKDIRVDQIEKVVRLVKGHGIRATYHFMGGFPSETTAEFLDTCRLIDVLDRMGPQIVVRELSVFAPYPGVGLIPECVKRGYAAPDNLEAWIDVDWTNPRRPWLTERQSRVISDAQFLIARLAHPNRVLRSWARFRWNQLLRGGRATTLVERPLIELAKRLVRRPAAGRGPVGTCNDPER